MTIRSAALLCLALAACQTAATAPAPQGTAKITLVQQNSHNEVAQRTFFPDDRVLIEFGPIGGRRNKPVWLPAVPGRFNQAEAAAQALFATWQPPGMQKACGASEHDAPLLKVLYTDETGTDRGAAGCDVPALIAADAALNAAINR